MKKKLLIIIISFFLFVLLLGIGCIFHYKNSLNPVDLNDNSDIVVIIENGTTTNQIISKLKKSNLIKDENMMKIYIKLNGGNAKAGRYVFKKNMGVSTIWSTIINGKVTNDTVWVTFVEGKRLSYIKKQIAASFPYTEDEIDRILEDKTYIKELINKYDILTDSILNEKIYHPLEGYLFPDTYEFMKDASIKDIIEKMISTMDAKVSKYADKISTSKYNTHELITLASIIELEGARSDDRKGVSGVFYNRLKSGWTLGSDVTTYYAVNKDFSEDLKWSELNSCNGYNTRGNCVKGLPVGPIASVSIKSLEAAIEPTIHDYYYFVADKNGKTYFSKTQAEHNNTIKKLQSSGMWYTYK